MKNLKIDTNSFFINLFSFFKKKNVDFISYAVSFFLVFSVFNTSFEIKLINLILVIILISLNKNIFRCFYQNFSENLGIIIFASLCVASYVLNANDYNILNNLKYKETNRPDILKIFIFSLLTILLFSYEKFFIKITNLVIHITSIILTFSLAIHFFVYEMSFISATLFLDDLKNEDLGSKNTMGIYLCILMPFIIHNLTKTKDIKNLYIFIIFTLSIFYTFSFSAFIIYAVVIFLFFLTLKKDYIFLILTIIAIFFIVSSIFKLTPEKLFELKYKTIVESNEIRGEIYDQEFEIKRFNEIYKDKKNNTFLVFFTPSSYRSRYILDALDGFLQKPLFGNGITSFQKNNIHYDNKKNIIRKPITHNDIFQILYEQGLVGIISFLYFTFFIIYKLFKKYKTGSETALIGIIQILVLLFSLNFINLIDHPLFWLVLSLNNVKNPNKTIK